MNKGWIAAAVLAAMLLAGHEVYSQGTQCALVFSGEVYYVRPAVSRLVGDVVPGEQQVFVAAGGRLTVHARGAVEKSDPKACEAAREKALQLGRKNVKPAGLDGQAR